MQEGHGNRKNHLRKNIKKSGSTYTQTNEQVKAKRRLVICIIGDKLSLYQKGWSLQQLDRSSSDLLQKHTLGNAHDPFTI